MSPQQQSFRKLLIGGLMVVTLGILLFLIFGRGNFEPHMVSRVSLGTEQFAHLDGDDVYAYNGLAFYKINLRDDNKITILNTGTKLPTPDSVYWAGSKGALLNFSDSFTFTKAEQIIRGQGLRLNEATRAYTWYLDFATGELSLVSNLPIYPDMAYFSEARKGFFYAPDYTRLDSLEHSDLPFGTTPLHFYDTETKKELIIEDDLSVVDMSYMGGCPEKTQLVCYIARDKDNTKEERLYAINAAGSVEELLNSQGRLFATNMPHYYVSAKVVADTEEHGEAEDIDEVVDYEPTPAYIHDLQKKHVKTLGFDVGDSDIAVSFDTAGNFAALTSSRTIGRAGDESSAYWTGKLRGSGKGSAKLAPLEFRSDEKFQGTFVGQPSMNSAGDMLFDTNGEGFLLLTDVREQKQLPLRDDATIQKVLEDCGSTTEDHEYIAGSSLYKVYFVENPQLEANIKTFSDCAVKADPNILLGYNFYFGVVDAQTGRISSD